MNALFRKEFGDLIRWTPIGIILIAVLGWMTIPNNVQSAVETGATMQGLVGLGCGLIALAFGLLQSLPELRNDVRGYLVHRPATMATIFWAKMLAGFATYLICVLPTMVVSAIYLESIGPERLPTSWMQVVPSSVMSLVIFVLYPASIWTVAREARWVGTRWFPLMFAIAGVLLANQFLDTMSSAHGLIAFVVVSLVMWAWVGAAALHAFKHQVFSPSPSDKDRMSISRGAGLLVATLLAVAIGVLFAAGFWESSFSTPGVSTSRRIAMDRDGRLWEVADVAATYGVQPTTTTKKGRLVSGQAVQDSDVLTPLPDDWDERTDATLRSKYRRWAFPFTPIGAVQLGDANPMGYQVVEREGRLYVYSNLEELTGYITPEGVYDANQTPEGRFDDPDLIGYTVSTTLHRSVVGQLLITDKHGVYQLDWEKKLVRKIIDTEVSLSTLVLPTENQDAVIWIENSSGLERYVLHAANPDQSLPRADSGVISQTGRYPMPAVTGELTKRLPLLPLDNVPSTKVVESEAGITAIIRRSYRNGVVNVADIYDAEGSLSEQVTMRLYPPPNEPIAVLPPGFVTGAFLWFKLAGRDGGPGDLPVSVFWAVAAHALLAVLLVQWIGSRLGLSLKQRVGWSVVALVVGVITGAAMLVICPRIVREKCCRCEAMRRVDQQRCGKCGADWDPPQPEGIEIIGDGHTVDIGSSVLT